MLLLYEHRLALCAMLVLHRAIETCRCAGTSFLFLTRALDEVWKDLVLVGMHMEGQTALSRVLHNSRRSCKDASVS